MIVTREIYFKYNFIKYRIKKTFKDIMITKTLIVWFVYIYIKASDRTPLQWYTFSESFKSNKNLLKKYYYLEAS